MVNWLKDRALGLIKEEIKAEIDAYEKKADERFKWLETKYLHVMEVYNKLETHSRAQYSAFSKLKRNHANLRKYLAENFDAMDDLPYDEGED